MFSTVSINFRPDDHGLVPFLKELSAFLEERGVRVLFPDHDVIRGTSCSRNIVSEEEFVSEADLVIAVGGDGTFLRTARMFVDSSKPMFGINRGNLGFLTEFKPGEYTGYLLRILEGDYSTAIRSVMEATHSRRGSRIAGRFFLNDAVLTKGGFSRAIILELEIDGQFLNSYSGDGLIISTATGSTAYSLSAGGPIVSPDVNNLFLLTPVCPHSLATRPMVLSGGSVLKARIVSEFRNLLLTIDGQEAIHIEGGDEIFFRMSDKRINLITHPEKNFYAILREKLGWG